MSEPVIDKATYDALVEAMGADFIGELIDTYCEEVPRLMADLQAALARDDAETFRRLAHSIKSSSSSFGALPFAAEARALEMEGKSGDLTGVEPAVARLVDDYASVEAALKGLRNGG
jgi:histidine phosphotransfer protein HptB